MKDVDLISNQDWDPTYLASIFSEDFYDMADHWNGPSYVSDDVLLNSTNNDKYCPIVEDISLDDDTLRSHVEEIESQLPTLEK